MPSLSSTQYGTFRRARQVQWHNCDNSKVQWPRQLWHINAQLLSTAAQMWLLYCTIVTHCTILTHCIIVTHYSTNVTPYCTIVPHCCTIVTYCTMPDTHARDTIVIETRPIVKTHGPRIHNWPTAGPWCESCEWKWVTVAAVIAGQLLWWSGGSCYYQWALVVTLVSREGRCPSSPAFLMPARHFFTRIWVMTSNVKKERWYQTEHHRHIFLLFFFKFGCYILLHGPSAFLDAPMNLLVSCLFYTGSVSMIDFSGKKRGGGAIKMGNKRRERG